MMKMNEIVMGRYATKQFDGKTIDESKIKELKELIRFAPSSFNIQPWRIKIITDKATKENLLQASYNQPQITTCSHLFVFCADSDIVPLIDKLEKQMIAAGLPAEKIATSVKWMRDFAGALNEEQRTAWAQRQLYLALGNALNGAKSLGFDSCPMEGFDPAAYSKILNLPKNIKPTALCPVGHAADKPMPKIRFSEEEVFF